MKPVYGKVFKTSKGEEFGVIRAVCHPFPDELSDTEIIAEDGCGNYFCLINGKVVFWDHETNDKTVLANSTKEFVAGCSKPANVELKPEQIISSWIDPEFAKKLGIDPKS